MLLRGPADFAEEFSCIAENIPNTGKFSWTPSTSLENDSSRYGLKIVVIGTGEYQYSTQFGVKNDNETPEESSSTKEDKPTSSTKLVKASSTTSTEHKPTYAPKNSTVVPSFTQRPSFVSSLPNNRSTTFSEPKPSNPITKPSSLGAPTSVVISTGPLVSQTPSATGAITSQPAPFTGAAVRMCAGGMLAGVGAMAALIL